MGDQTPGKIFYGRCRDRARPPRGRGRPLSLCPASQLHGFVAGVYRDRAHAPQRDGLAGDDAPDLPRLAPPDADRRNRLGQRPGRTVRGLHAPHEAVGAGSDLGSP